jgi:hypothetical protein
MRNIGTGLLEWCQDNGYTLLSANDNVVKTIEDLDIHNLYDPNPKGDDIQYPAKSDNGFHQDDSSHSEYSCPGCDRLFGSYAELLSHQLREEGENPTAGVDPIVDSGFPEIANSDNPMPSPKYVEYTDFSTTGSVCPHIGYEYHRVADAFHLSKREYDQYLVAYRGGPTAVLQLHDGRVSGMAGKPADVQWLLAKLAFENQKAPQANLAGPLPFIYDIDSDEISFGQPGTRTSDIPGQFSPGGIVDGIYDPDGKLVIHTFSNMPWSANHLLQLWYAYQPTLEVKSVHLRDDAGGDTRLAAWRPL